VSTKNKKISFEESVSELEGITQALQSGKLTLEETVQAYEKGITLKNNAMQSLNSAKLRLNTVGTSQSFDKFSQNIIDQAYELTADLKEAFLSKNLSKAKDILGDYTQEVLKNFAEYSQLDSETNTGEGSKK